MSVKPSWLVTKLIEALGRRRPRPKTSSLPASRVARSWRVRRRAPPGVPHRVAEPVVPLAPRRREPSEVVPVGHGVPRFGDELQLGSTGSAATSARNGAARSTPCVTPQQRGGQVEAEAVHVQLVGPAAQGRHHQRPVGRAAEIDGVAAAGRVLVRAVGRVPVPPGVVPAAAAERGTGVVVLARVVEDDVDDHLEPGVVERADHRLALADLLAAVTGRVARVRREPGDGVVAPEVAQAARPEGAAVHEVRHRQQLDRRHPEVEEVVDHRGVGQAEVGATQRRAGTSGWRAVIDRTLAS